MIIPGQHLLKPLSGSGVTPEVFAPEWVQELRDRYWIETVEEFFSLAPILDSVDPDFANEWEEIEDNIRNSDAKQLEHLRHLAAEWTIGSNTQDRPLGDAVSQENRDFFNKYRELRHGNLIDSVPTDDTFPPKFSLTEKFEFGPMIDQKGEGECVACTVTPLVEFVLESKEPLSYKFLYRECKKRDGFLQSRGTDLKTAMAIVSEVGICPESCYSNAEEDFQEPDDEKCYAEADHYRMESCRTVLPGDVRHIKTVLTGCDGVKPMPIATTLLVFDSWYHSRSASRTGKWTLPLPGEMPKSCSHAVLIVGYQDDPSVPGGGFFIARNSWGESWANLSPVSMNGHALIPYAYVQRYACDAFTGPRIIIDEFEQKYCDFLKKETRDCVDDRKYKIGTAVLVNPSYPEDYREDTQDNRKKFREYNFVWKEENRYDLVKQAIDKMYQEGRGELGQASICVKHVVNETGFTSEEVEKLFYSLERKNNYTTYKTDNGDLAIRRPEK